MFLLAGAKAAGAMGSATGMGSAPADLAMAAADAGPKWPDDAAAGGCSTTSALAKAAASAVAKATVLATASSTLFHNVTAIKRPQDSRGQAESEP